MITVKHVQTEDDYQQCLDIRRKVFIEEQNISERDEVDSYEKEALHFLATLNAKPVATGRIRIKGSFMKFERVATLKEARGKGIASALMKEMERVSSEKHPAYLMAMHAQTSAIPFYLKLGWVAVGPIFVEAEIEHQLMIFPPKNNEELKCLSDPECPQAVLDYFSHL